MDRYARQFQLSSYTQTCCDESKHQCWQCCTACTDEAACPILRSIRICVRSPSLDKLASNCSFHSWNVCSHGGLSKANELSFSPRLCDVRAHLRETHSHEPLRISTDNSIRLYSTDNSVRMYSTDKISDGASRCFHCVRQLCQRTRISLFA